MRQVSKEEFFATMNPLNVHPRVDISTLHDELIVSRWEMQDTRRVVGTSKGTGNKAIYHLTT
jgi:hypothetical protein